MEEIDRMVTVDGDDGDGIVIIDFCDFVSLTTAAWPKLVSAYFIIGLLLHSYLQNYLLVYLTLLLLCKRLNKEIYS